MPAKLPWQGEAQEGTQGTGRGVGGSERGEQEAESLTQALKNAIHFLLGPREPGKPGAGMRRQLCRVCLGGRVQGGTRDPGRPLLRSSCRGEAAWLINPHWAGTRRPGGEAGLWVSRPGSPAPGVASWA